MRHLRVLDMASHDYSTMVGGGKHTGGLGPYGSPLAWYGQAARLTIRLDLKLHETGIMAECCARPPLK